MAPGCRMAASFRYGVTITGAILLVTGTLCFAWWSDGEVGPTSNNDAMAVPHGEAKVVPNSSSSNALLRSVSFFCCGIGGFLLLFGLLWSVKANARGMSRHYQYHFSRDLHYFTVEPLDKRMCRLVQIVSILLQESVQLKPSGRAQLLVSLPYASLL
uniref:Transmembrane protein 61 n=1 Tax=Gopherus evgoodei TaxID=1825980 RepID=A0A8C5F307_9SAUR